jgi:hypothetical protein
VRNLNLYPTAMTLQILKRKIQAATDVPAWVLEDIQKVEEFQIECLENEIALLEGEIQLERNSEWWKE